MKPNFRGYYLKVGNVVFNDPAPKRESFKFATKLVQVGDSSVLASGYLSIKVLPHTRRKIWCEFPPMTIEQHKKYKDALFGDTGGAGMYLTVEAYDEDNDEYITDTYYHTDIVDKPIKLGGKEMMIFEPFELIGHQEMNYGNIDII